MNFFITDIEKITLENTDYRRVLYTTPQTQVVVMSLEPTIEIGMEVHDLDQFIRVEAGEGRAVIDGAEKEIKDGTAIVIPKGTDHNIINTGTTPLKLYSIYSPPEHQFDVVQKEKKDEKEEHFDGRTNIH